MLAGTWGDFLTDLWHTEIVSWDSFLVLVVLTLIFRR
jgi:hypothetical protein